MTLHPRTAREIHCRLDLLDRLPGLCRQMLADQAAASDAAWAAVLETEAAPAGWPTWAVVGAGAGGFAVGMLLTVWVVVGG